MAWWKCVLSKICEAQLILLMLKISELKFVIPFYFWMYYTATLFFFNTSLNFLHFSKKLLSWSTSFTKYLHTTKIYNFFVRDLLPLYNITEKLQSIFFGNFQGSGHPEALRPSQPRQVVRSVHEGQAAVHCDWVSGMNTCRRTSFSHGVGCSTL